MSDISSKFDKINEHCVYVRKFICLFDTIRRVNEKEMQNDEIIPNLEHINKYISKWLQATVLIQ